MTRQGMTISQSGYGHWHVSYEYRGKRIGTVTTDSQFIDNLKQSRATKAELASMRRQIRAAQNKAPNGKKTVWIDTGHEDGPKLLANRRAALKHIKAIILEGDEFIDEYNAGMSEDRIFEVGHLFFDVFESTLDNWNENYESK